MPKRSNQVGNLNARSKPIGLRLREGFWHYRFKVNSQEYTGNTNLAATQQNVNDALEIRAMERQKILGGGIQAPEIYPFSKAADMFLNFCDGEYRDHPRSAKRIRGSFSSLKAFFKREPVMNIQSGVIDNYKTYRRSMHVAEVTLRNDLNNLSLFFQYAKGQKWCTVNPLDDVEIPSGEDAIRMYILSPEEQIKYLNEASRISLDLFDLASIMLFQGCRPEEIMTLERANVDLKRRTFYISKGKSRAAKRTLKMRPTVHTILKNRLSAPASRWVFPSTRKPGLCITKLNNAHNLACERINLDIVLYDLRHTFATRMALKGCPIPNLAAILGHGSLRSVQKYIHPGQENLDDSMDRYGDIEPEEAPSTFPSPFRPPPDGTERAKRRF